MENSEEDSFYSCDEEYFLDICRGGELQQIKQFVHQLNKQSKFDWLWINNTKDNFIHMLAANNHFQVFNYIFSELPKFLDQQAITQIINGLNSSGNTPLHYAVIGDAKQMVQLLLKNGVDPNIKNKFNRTALNQAEDFDKLQIAQILAPFTQMDIDQIKKYTEGLVLNDNDSDEQQSPKKKPLTKVQQEHEETQNKNEKQKI